MCRQQQHEEREGGGGKAATEIRGAVEAKVWGGGKSGGGCRSCVRETGGKGEESSRGKGDGTHEAEVWMGGRVWRKQQQEAGGEGEMKQRAKV